MYSFVQIKSDAENLLKETGLYGVFPVDLEQIAKHLGFEALGFTGKNDISGAINYKARRIYVNQDDSPQRQRFTLAHEIGHARLHQGDSIIDYRSQFDLETKTGLKVGVGRKETEANVFAANILMPEEFFKAVWRTREGDRFRIANYFGVSIPAASFRIRNLDLE